MLDMLGQTVYDGDVIAYGQRSGNSGHLTIGLVVNSGTKRVHGFNSYSSGWTPRARSGKLNNYERAVKIKPHMIADPELRKAIGELIRQYDLQD